MDADLAAVLAALADGIIPADEIDDGAGAVNAGERLAERALGEPYLSGLETARAVSREEYGRGVGELGAVEIETVLALLRERAPAFFTQLRMDVSALYMSDEGVWRRIGFPGPSIRSGGYADFDQAQMEKVVRLKEKE